VTFPPVYPIIDIDLCRMLGVEPALLASAFLDAGARLLQVRQKSGSSSTLLSLVRSIVADANTRSAGVIVNDRSDVAALAGAAGVHVGQSDLPVDVVKSIAGSRSLVGLSTHTRSQVDEALAGPADYIAVGPVFRTATKDTGYEPRGLELVRYAAGKGKPVVAIGGISIANAHEVIEAGAASIAVISDLLASGDPEGRVREYLDALR
jgi:thiamine-phosphate pyrophosphorylase